MRKRKTEICLCIAAHIYRLEEAMANFRVMGSTPEGASDSDTRHDNGSMETVSSRDDEATNASDT